MTTMSDKVRGLRNNNPLNIRKGNNWQGERHPQTDPLFEEFQSMQMGLRAGFKLVRNYIEGRTADRVKRDNINKLIARWAPASENNTRAYINTVCQHTGLHELETLRWRDRSKIVAVVRAMAFVECGVWLDVELCRSAYDLV